MLTSDTSNAANCGRRDASAFKLRLWLSSTSATAQMCVAMCPSSLQGPAEGIPMKKLLIALVATLVAVSVSGCVGIGKGKGKAPPIVTKG